MAALLDALYAQADEFIAIRQDIHENPELAYEEFRTSNTDAARACASLQLPDNTRAADTTLDSIAPTGELFSDDIRGTKLFICKLGILVNVLTNRDEFVGLGVESVE